MNFDEALEILGIDVTAGKKGARRAYLKLIKVHKPDRDPVMFRRIREAYERVKDDIEFMARFHRPATPPPEPEAPPILDPQSTALNALLEREGVDESIEERAPEPPVIRERAPEPPVIEERAPEPPVIRERAPEPPVIEERAPDPLRIDLVDDPLRMRVHDEPRVRIDPVSRPPEPPEPEQPESKPPEPEPRVIPAEERVFVPPSLLVHDAVQFAESGQGGRAQQLALQGFAVAHRFPEADPPSAYDAIQVTLLLFASGRVVAGRKVGRAMRTWLTESGVERSFMGQKLAASLAIVQAFLELPPDAPPRPIAIIARALLDGALESAQPHLKTFAHDSPYSAVVAADMFRDHSTMLHTLFGERLRQGRDVVEEYFMQRGQQPPRVPQTQSKGCGWSILGYVAVMFVVAIIGRALTSSGGSSYRPPRIDIPKIRNFKPVTLPSIPLNIDHSRPLWLNLLCAKQDTPTCQLANTLESAIDNGDCEQARLALKEIVAAASTDALVKPSLRLIRLDVDRTCRLGTSGTSAPTVEPPWQADICENAADHCINAKVLAKLMKPLRCGPARLALRRLEAGLAKRDDLTFAVTSARAAVQARCPDR